MRRKEYDQALELYQQALSLRRELWEADPADVLVAGRVAFMVGQIGATHLLAGHTEQAAPLLRDSLQWIERLPPEAGNEIPSNEVRLRAYIGLGDIAASAEEDNCRWDHRAAELLREDPGLRRGIDTVEEGRRLLEGALERAESCAPQEASDF